MAEPFETLVFVARLTREEKDSIFAREAAFPGANIGSRLLLAAEDVCLDRLLLADGCLSVARQLAHVSGGGTAPEECLRAAVSRAYYSIHHSIRAIALWHNK